jgi:nitrous oxide reductase accessory protein NosL
MKKLIILAAVSAFTFSACNSHKASETSSTITVTSDSTQVYACSMDPEITGKKGEKCSKCGMDLTEPVAQKEVKKDSIQ